MELEQWMWVAFIYFVFGEKSTSVADVSFEKYKQEADSM